MAATGVDVVGLDWTIDMADARARVGSAAVQVRGLVVYVIQCSVLEFLSLKITGQCGSGGAVFDQGRHHGCSQRRTAKGGATWTHFEPWPWRTSGYTRGECGPYV